MSSVSSRSQGVFDDVSSVGSRSQGQLDQDEVASVPDEAEDNQQGEIKHVPTNSSFSIVLYFVR